MCNKIPKFKLPVKGKNGQSKASPVRDYDRSKSPSKQMSAPSDVFNLDAFSNVFDDKDDEKDFSADPFNMGGLLWNRGKK